MVIIYYLTLLLSANWCSKWRQCASRSKSWQHRILSLLCLIKLFMLKLIPLLYTIFYKTEICNKISNITRFLPLKLSCDFWLTPFKKKKISYSHSFNQDNISETKNRKKSFFFTLSYLYFFKLLPRTFT